MSVNVPLLRKMVEWVEEQEKLTEGREWWQGFWATDTSRGTFIELVDSKSYCGTAFCVAGKLAYDDGWKPKWLPDGEAYEVTRDGETKEIAGVAAGLLGIAPDTRLFDANNTAAVIRRIAEDITGERL